MNTLNPWARGALLLAGLAAVAVAKAEELVHWQKEPIPLTLTVGQERTLFFPDNVRVGVPQKLDDAAFRTQSTSGAAYWLAKQPFANERIQAKLAGSGLTLLFDVSAVPAPAQGDLGKAEALRVVLPEGLTEAAPTAEETPAEAAEAPASAVTPVTLTRYAAQQFYAPERLLQDRPDIVRTPMRAPRNLPGLVFGGRLDAQPLVAWQGGGWYVTAVRLTNRSAESVSLDPRDLRGRFRYATFQHLTQGPRGSETDTTCVYLVTERPFGDALTLR